MKNILVLSHDDLDGYGANIVAHFVKGASVEVDNLSNKEVDDAVLGLLASRDFEEYDHIFMTDISMSVEVARILDEYIKDFNIKFTLLDHHKTAVPISQEFDWAHVCVDGYESGSSLFFKYMIDHYNIPVPCLGLSSLINEIRLYDTWNWVKEGIESPAQLNDLFLYYEDKNKFVESIVYEISENFNDTFEFSKQQKTLIECITSMRDAYINKKLSQMFVGKIHMIDQIYQNEENIDLDGIRVGVIFASQNISMLGNAMMSKWYDNEGNRDTDRAIDLAILIDLSSEKISFRSNKDGVDASIAAQEFGGGGHREAAGSPLDGKLVRAVIESCFA